MKPGDVAVWSRDLWLARAVTSLRPQFAEQGLVVPGICVHAGKTLVTSAGLETLGECWPRKASSDGRLRVVVGHQTSLADAVLAILVHELIHAVDNCVHGHGPWFQSWAAAMGLHGSTHTYPSAALKLRLTALAIHLGPYPPGAVGYVVTRKGRLVA